MRTLLLIVTLVSNFPLLIVGMGAILLIVLVVLVCRSRQKKVRPVLYPCAYYQETPNNFFVAKNL